MLVITCLMGALAFSQGVPAAESTGRIAGRVMVEGTNTAVAGARIILLPTARRMGPMGPPLQAVTDQNGRFVFERVAPGAYRIDAQKTGLVPLNLLGQNRTTDVVAGRSVELDLQLQKGGVIAGRLLDPSGEPLPDARIMALRRVTLPGALPRLIGAAGPGTQTNDLGEFRVSGLAPGEYYVAAMVRGASPFGAAGTPLSTTGGARTTMTTTFYPGTTDQFAAQPIMVAAAAEAGNIVFTMQSSPAFQISGVVVDENGSPVAGAMVMLMSDPRWGLFMGPGGGAQSQDDGRFVIGEVPAGSYRVTASIPIRMNGPGSNTGFVTLSGGSILGTVSSGVVAGGSVGAVVSGAGTVVSGLDQPTEVVVTDADVSGVRVMVRRPARR